MNFISDFVVERAEVRGRSPPIGDSLISFSPREWPLGNKREIPLLVFSARENFQIF